MLTCAGLEFTVALYRSGLGPLPSLFEVMFYVVNYKAIA